MAKIDYNSWQQYSKRESSGFDVGFFQLKGDGASTIVRFIESDPAKYDIGTLHVVKEGDKYKKVSCIRTPFDPIDNCPLCASGNKPQAKIFVKCIQYVEDNGEIVEKPCIWERPASFAQKLTALEDEYGLDGSLFKVVRTGSGLDTKYDVLYAPESKYPREKYPHETESKLTTFSAFGRIVKELNFADLQKYASSESITTEQESPTQVVAKEPMVETRPTAPSEPISTGLPFEPDELRNEPQQVSSVERLTQRQRKPWEVPDDVQEQQIPTRPRRY